MSMRMFASIARAAMAAALLAAVTATPHVVRAQEAGTYDHYDVYDPDLLPNQVYAERRGRVRAALDSGAAMLVRSADVRNRSNDVDFPYRQRNSMLYLSGVTEDESALLILPRPIKVDGIAANEILFVSRRRPEMEVWTGLRMGPATAARITGIAVVLPDTRMRGLLDTVMARLSVLYYDAWSCVEIAEPLTDISNDCAAQQLAALKKSFPRLDVRAAAKILDPLRVIKDSPEIVLMQRAVDISIEAHRRTIAAATPGMHEYELAAVMEYHFHRLGSESPGYPSIVGSGPNSCILHYETNRRQARAGELVLMDCGAEYHGYSADVTRTFPISGKFTAEQRSIYDLVLAAQEAGIAECRAGNSFVAPHRVATSVIADGLIKLGIIKDPADCRRYFMHGTSHFLGLDVHDVGIPGTLRPGMVLTVEPGIYIPAGSKCDPRWWNIGVRIEDDILVTSDEPFNMSGALPRAAADIEAMVGTEARKP